MLGTALDKDIPKNSTLKITPTDSRRAKAYQRMTGGALDFNVKKEPNYYGRLRDTFDDGASYLRAQYAIADLSSTWYLSVFRFKLSVASTIGNW